MFEPEQMFGHFKIIRKLGEGGMGMVFLAEDQKLKRHVALKILQADFFDNPDRLARFIREAKMAAQISHPNVMAIYDLDKAVDEKTGRELNYIVMENISGDTLTNYLTSRSPGIQELLRLSEKMASGLAAAHKLGIVHRDIKSDNIKIDDNGDPKILDFGLAKPLNSTFLDSNNDTTGSATGGLTQEGKILGTVSYMSPEQARGEPVDTRSDIFSFGILMYRLFTGIFPFEADSRVATLAKILESRQAPLRQMNESLPSELERIVDKCMQKNRDDRYQDTRDLIVDLRSLRRQFASRISDSDSSISDLPKIKASRTFTFKAKHLAFMAAIAALIVVVFLWLKPDGKKHIPPGLQAKENALAILTFENKTGDTTLNWLESGLPEILLTDLAQHVEINIVSRQRLLDTYNESDKKPTHQSLLDRAEELGAMHAISGAFYKLGKKIRIDARLENVRSGQIIRGDKVMGEDPFVLVDSLTQKIAQSLDIKNIEAGARDVAEMTSSSPEAYKEYILGMEKFRQNLYEDAIIHFERSIEIDSTFALPYFRIGMTHFSNGRQHQSTPYFAAAEKLKDRLPLREKNKLEIYLNMFLLSKFDDAYVQMQTFLNNYPDDKEVRSLYAIFLYQISQNPDAALAQLDTVLLVDPKYQLALTNYITIQADLSNYEIAIEYSKRLKNYYPQSSSAYTMLAAFYRMTGEYDKAIAECKQNLKITPKATRPLTQLTRLYIQKRDFDSARIYADKIVEINPDDIYTRLTHIDMLLNLANWRGKFKQAHESRMQALRLAHEINDSNHVQSAYMSLAQSFRLQNKTDSAIYYARKGSDYAVGFRILQYPLFLAQVDRSRGEEARPEFDRAIKFFKENIPDELWLLADLLADIFEARCQADTTAVIEALEEMIKQPFQQDSDDIYTLGKLLVQTGQYERGIQTLQKLLEGEYQTSDAVRYLRSIYYIGIAEEALGNFQAAKEKYEELLGFWGNPEIEIKEIADTRKRLSAI